MQTGVQTLSNSPETLFRGPPWLECSYFYQQR